MSGATILCGLCHKAGIYPFEPQPHKEGYISRLQKLLKLKAGKDIAIGEAAARAQERDYPELFHFNGEDLRPIFQIQSQGKSPEVVDANTYIVASIGLMYDLVKAQFKNDTAFITCDLVVVDLNGAKQFDEYEVMFDLNDGKLFGAYAYDVVIVDYKRQAIFIVEVEATLDDRTLRKAGNQLEKSRSNFNDCFQSEIKGKGWKVVSMILAKKIREFLSRHQ